MGNVQDSEADPSQNGNNRPPDRPPKPMAPYPISSPVYPTIDNGDYEVLNPNLKPARPAPVRPAPSTPGGGQSTHTLSTQQAGLDGVPFIINPKFMNSSGDKVLGYSPIN